MRAHAHPDPNFWVKGQLSDQPRPLRQFEFAMAIAIWSVLVAPLILYICLKAIPAAVRFVARYHRHSRAVRDVPGWPRHWFWGNLHNVTSRDITVWWKWREFNESEFKLTRVWVGPFHPQMVVTHCSLVPSVLKLPKDLFFYNFLLPWLGEGLLLSKERKWHRNRRLLTSAFHFETLKPYVSIYNHCLETFICNCSAAADRQEPVKLFETLSKLSLDILLQCAFSCKTDCQSETESVRHPYIQCVYDMSDLIVLRSINPLYFIDWLYFLTPSGRRMKKACKFVHDYAEDVIHKRKKALGLDSNNQVKEISVDEMKSKKKFLDFLDILLLARDEKGEGLNDLEIRNEVDTFMFEGHDTTTSALSWALFLLAKHPKHQDKVREEVKAVLDGRDRLEYEDLKELKYTQWCIKETLRLYPPVYQIFRVADCDFELDGRTVPKGMKIAVNIIDVHRHKDTWDRPEEFDPLRFSPDNCKGRDPYAYIPFSASLRNCIGQNFAMNEELVVIATVVHCFSLSVTEGHKVEAAPDMILRARNDLKLSFHPICD